jgi:hypothetical protein
VIGALQFNVLTALGLREHHYLLDLGCGSLRGGRLFIPYLLPGHYFGIEPDRSLVEDGIDNELGRDILKVKRPTFEYVDDFRLSIFGREFDFVLAQSVFTHAAASQIRTCLAEGQKVLTADGALVATYFEGEDNYEGSDWVYPGRVLYRFDFMASLAEDAGLGVSRLEWTHPNGQSWLRFSRSSIGNTAAS